MGWPFLVSHLLFFSLNFGFLIFMGLDRMKEPLEWGLEVCYWCIFIFDSDLEAGWLFLKEWTLLENQVLSGNNKEVSRRGGDCLGVIVRVSFVLEEPEPLDLGRRKVGRDTEVTQMLRHFINLIYWRFAQWILGSPTDLEGFSAQRRSH